MVSEFSLAGGGSKPIVYSQYSPVFRDLRLSAAGFPLWIGNSFECNLPKLRPINLHVKA
jgi:hypothetical protein